MRWTKSTIRYIALLVIVLVALIPQRASSQFSDSTIREINSRLLELHRCREKQTLYVRLRHSDSITIHNQDEAIHELIIATNEQKVAKEKYQILSAFSSVMLLLALIL